MSLSRFAMTVVFCCLALLPAGAAGAQASAPASRAAVSRPADEVDHLLSEARRCYGSRHQVGMADRAVKLAKQAQALAPTRFDTQLMVARAAGYRASDMPPGLEKRALAQLGYRAATKLIAIDDTRVEGHYYAALSLGLYGEGLGIIAALREGLKGRFEGHVEEAVRIDRYYSRGAPLIAQARYFAMLPWPLHDRDRARELIVEVGQRFPRHPRVEFFYADVAVYEGRREEGIRRLKALISKLPDWADDYPDGVTVKRWATARLREVQAE